MRSLAIALIEQERITTTEARAKSLRTFVEKLITKARVGSLESKRLVLSRLGNNLSATKKLVEEIAPRYADRPGGYTRIVKMQARSGDASPMALIELV